MIPFITNPSGFPVRFEATSAKALPEIPVGDDGLIFESPKKIYIGTGGDLKCRLVGDTDFSTFTNLPDGQPFFGIVIAIHADSTVSDVLILE